MLLEHRTAPPRGFIPETPSSGLQTFDENALLDALEAGHEPSYEILVERYGGRMLAVAQRLLRDEDEAQDVVQEAFICCYRNLGRFRRGSRLATWLHRITVNAALMRIRRRGCRPEDQLDESIPPLEARADTPAFFSRPASDAEHRLLQRETRQRVRECVDRLPERYRTVLVLRDLEELDTQEVAQMLGVTANAVKIRLHRARQALTSLLLETGFGVAASK